MPCAMNALHLGYPLTIDLDVFVASVEWQIQTEKREDLATVEV